MTPTRIALALALVAALAGPSRSASAANGIVEIDQEKALTGGVTPGDAPGFPVTLSEPGSYRLTGTLVVATSANAVEIEADGLTLDLGGFGVQHTAAGARGTSVYGPSRSRVTVTNGTLSRGHTSIDLGPLARVWNVTSPGDSYTFLAVEVGPSSIIADLIASTGEGTAIAVGDGSLVQTSAASGDHIAVLGATRSVVVDSEVRNGLRGLVVSGSVVRRTSVLAGACSFSPHPRNVAVAASMATMIEDSVSEGCLSKPNVPGLLADAGTSISRSLLRSNTGPVLVMDGDSTYRDSTITNSGGVAVIGGVDLGGNSCNGEPCP